MLCVVVLEVEDGDFSDWKGSALDVHSCVIVERQGRKTPSRTGPAPSRNSHDEQIIIARVPNHATGNLKTEN